MHRLVVRMIRSVRYFPKKQGDSMDLPSGNIAIDNDHLYWVYPLRMVIFHSYVSLPEGT